MKELEVGDHVHLYLDDRADPHDALVWAFVRSMTPMVQVTYIVAEPLSSKLTEVPLRHHRDPGIPERPYAIDPHGVHRE